MKFAIFILFAVLINPLFGQSFVITENDQGIEISEGGKKVLFYQIQPKSMQGKFERAGYVHPLYNLNNEIITEDFPKDHLHHHGIFWAWHQIILNGKNIGDSWTSENISWEIKKAKAKKQKEGASLKSVVIWNANVEAGKMPIIRENTQIDIMKATGEYRIIDFTVQLSALANNLEIGGSDDVKGYGGFSIRLKDPEHISFVSQGKNYAPKNESVIAGPWMDFLGDFGTGTKSGVSVLNHPSNPGNVKEWILRNQTSMQNPVFPGRSAVKLPSSGITLKYRLIIHNGKLSQDRIQQMYDEYAKREA